MFVTQGCLIFIIFMFTLAFSIFCLVFLYLTSWSGLFRPLPQLPRFNDDWNSIEIKKNNVVWKSIETSWAQPLLQKNHLKLLVHYQNHFSNKLFASYAKQVEPRKNLSTTLAESLPPWITCNSIENWNTNVILWFNIFIA